MYVGMGTVFENSRFGSCLHFSLAVLVGVLDFETAFKMVFLGVSDFSKTARKRIFFVFVKKYMKTIYFENDLSS